MRRALEKLLDEVTPYYKALAIRPDDASAWNKRSNAYGCAIDYLQTGNTAWIEKLSPEVKGIVEEVVETLQTVAKDTTVPRS